MSHIAKGTIRQIKNYTKGYSDIQAKVRSATSNDPWGPSGTIMNEIAQASYNHEAFLEIMEIIDKRLNDHGKNWRHVFKALTLLDYCLHVGSQDVVAYAKENIYVVKTLREFQYIDDEGKDQGANVRQKAKEITNLLLDDDRLNFERRQRSDMRNRMGRNDSFPGMVDRSLSSTPTYDNSVLNEEDDADMKKAMEESLKTARNEADRKTNEEEADLAKALKLSQEEEERRQAEQAKKNEMSLFDTGISSNQFSQQTDFFGNPINSTNPQYGVPFSKQPFDSIDLLDQQNNLNNQSQYLTQYQLLQQQQQQQQQQQLLQMQQQQLQQQQQQQQQLQQQQQQQQLQQLQQQQLQQQQQQQQLLQLQQQQQLNNPYQQQANTAVGSKNPFGPFSQQTQSTSLSTTSYSSNSTSPFGNLASSNLSSPNLSTVSTIDSVFNTGTSNQQPPKPQDEKHAKLATLIGNRGDGMDTFGNVGNLRVPTGSGFANSSNLSVQAPRRSNSVGNLSGSANQANPFLPTSNVGTYNTLPSTFGTQQAGSTKDLFSTFSTTSSTINPSISQPAPSFSTTSYTATSDSLIDLDGGGFSSQQSKNPFQTLSSVNTISNANKPKSLNDLGRENQYMQQSQQTLNIFGQPNQGSSGGFW